VKLKVEAKKCKSIGMREIMGANHEVNAPKDGNGVVLVR